MLPTVRFITLSFKNRLFTFWKRSDTVDRSAIENVAQDDPHDLASVLFILTRHQFMENNSARTNPTRSSSVTMSSFATLVESVGKKLPPNHHWLSHAEGSNRLSDRGVPQLGHHQGCLGPTCMFFSHLSLSQKSEKLILLTLHWKWKLLPQLIVTKSGLMTKGPLDATVSLNKLCWVQGSSRQSNGMSRLHVGSWFVNPWGSFFQVANVSFDHSMCPTFAVRWRHHSNAKISHQFDDLLRNQGVGIVRDQNLRTWLVHKPAADEALDNVVGGFHIGLSKGVGGQNFRHTIVCCHVHQEDEFDLEVLCRNLPLADVDSKVFPSLWQWTQGK